GVGDDHLAEQREAVHLRHHQIGDHDVGAVAVERRQRLLAVGCDLHLISLTLERGREDLPEALFIVDDEHAVCHLRWGLSRPLEAWQTNRNARAARQLVRTGRIGGPVTRLATLLLAAGASLAACSSSPNCETCASLGNACVPPGACTPSSCERSIVTSALPAAQVQSLGVHKVGTELTFAVPSGAGSVTIVQQAKIAGLTVVYKNQVIDNSAVPLTVTFPDGRIAYDDNVDAGNPSLDVAFYIVADVNTRSGAPLRAANAPNDPNVKRMVQTVQSIMADAGIAMNAQFYDVSDAARTRFGTNLNVTSTGPCEEMNQMFT